MSVKPLLPPGYLTGWIIHQLVHLGRLLQLSAPMPHLLSVKHSKLTRKLQQQLPHHLLLPSTEVPRLLRPLLKHVCLACATC